MLVKFLDLCLLQNKWNYWSGDFVWFTLVPEVLLWSTYIVEQNGWYSTFFSTRTRIFAPYSRLLYNNKEIYPVELLSECCFVELWEILSFKFMLLHILLEVPAFTFVCSLLKIHLHGGTGKDGRRKLIGWLSKVSICLWRLLVKRQSGRKYFRSFLFFLEFLVRFG